MARLFADENFPRPVVEQLRELGHDVLTTGEASLGGRGVSDYDILQDATNDGRFVLTINRRDFVRLHRTLPDHTGIVVCTFNPIFREQASAISLALDAHETFDGQLIRVNRPGRRQRRHTDRARFPREARSRTAPGLTPAAPPVYTTGYNVLAHRAGWRFDVWLVEQRRQVACHGLVRALTRDEDGFYGSKHDPAARLR